MFEMRQARLRSRSNALLSVLSSSSSSATVQGNVSLPHYRTLEVRTRSGQEELVRS